MEQTKRQSLGSAPIGKLLRTFAIPSIISMVVSTLYNIVDQVFIGRGVGYLGNGATNVILPITVIALALGLMIGDGATAFFSLCLGQKELKNAAQCVGNAHTLTVIVSVVLTVASFVWLRPLCILFSATETIMPYALEYGSIIVLGFPFYMFSMGVQLGGAGGWQSGLCHDGNPQRRHFEHHSGPPLYLCVWDGGDRCGHRNGAGPDYIHHSDGGLSAALQVHPPHPECLIPRFKLCLKLCSLGVSSFFLQLAATIVIAVMNNVLVKYGAASKYGAEIPMTTLGITMKINQIITGIVIGIAVGSQPIIGYNYGAGKMDRARKTYFLAVGCATVVMALGTAVFQLFPEAIISIFGSESALY